MIAILGYIAALLTTASFIPQAIMVIKTKNTDGISLGMYLSFTIGVALWTIYGVIAQLNAIIFANAITLIFASIILTYKIKSNIKTKPAERGMLN